MFNGSFLSSSFRVFFPFLSREALLVATTLTRVGGGCSGGHVIYLSPYYPPSPCARVSAFSASLFTSYLLEQQLHRVAPSWALPLSPPLFVPLSFFPARATSPSRSREETGTRFPPFLVLRRRAVSLCFSYFSSPSSAPPFCFPALYPPTSLPSFSSPSILSPFPLLLLCLSIQVSRILF